MTDVQMSQRDRRINERLIHGRQVLRQWKKVSITVAVVSVMVLCALLAQRHIESGKIAILRERSEAILRAMRDVRTAPPYDRSAGVVYSPSMWKITQVEVIGIRGHVLAAIDHPDADGVPGTMVWELRFSDTTDLGWSCTSIITVGTWFDEDGWRR
jgi:hypothetical protein